VISFSPRTRRDPCSVRPATSWSLPDRSEMEQGYHLLVANPPSHIVVEDRLTRHLICPHGHKLTRGAQAKIPRPPRPCHRGRPGSPSRPRFDAWARAFDPLSGCADGASVRLLPRSCAAAASGSSARASAMHLRMSRSDRWVNLLDPGPATVSWAAFVACASWDHLLADVLSSSQPVEQAQPHHRDSKQDHRPSRQEQ
jgi:hypothetical protein